MTVLVPYVIEKSGREERAMDIYSRLLADRIVFLGTGVNDEVAPLAVALAHFRHDILRPVQSGDGGVHGEGGGRGDGLAVHLGGHFHHGRRAGQPAEAPASHGVSFGKAIDSERALGHAGLGAEGVMDMIVED